MRFFFNLFFAKDMIPEIIQVGDMGESEDK
jgi:hypothetical protein